MANTNNNSGAMPNSAPFNRLDVYRSTGFNTPEQQPFDSPEMRGSIQNILAANIDKFVVIEFIVGTQEVVRKQGILYLVGTSFVTLYDEILDIFIVCDLFSIKFVYFYTPSNRPSRNYNILPAQNGQQRNQNTR